MKYVLEHEKSYKIGIGATIGFAVIVSLGVFLGAVITKFIPISTIAIISGIIFMVLGIIEIPKIKKLYHEKSAKLLDNISEKDEGVEDSDLNESVPSKLSKLKKNPYFAGFIFIFVMELGDKTQVLTITLASVYSSTIEVWIGSFLALASLAWMGVFFGAFIAKKIPKLYLKLGSAIIFISIGLITLLIAI
ncbi:MAG TPA: TMEM165/GDT1 family protein [Candidatus Nealsonbacteria bacterium]|nr:TMEM165/GDT1 family protein [Candidatus Nealsonbacteria bacterium]